MRDCFFLVADKNMEGMLKGFFSRPDFHRAIGCAPFEFDARQDLKVAHGQNDPGLFTRANALLQPYANMYRHAVVIVDADWDGSPGAAAIQQQIESHLQNAGWSGSHGLAIVIDPELENWVWQSHREVAAKLGFSGEFEALRALLMDAGFWRTNENKPYRPKEAVEWLLRRNRKSRSSALYQQLAIVVPVGRCTDAAFVKLKAMLCEWFPVLPK